MRSPSAEKVGPLILRRTRVATPWHAFCSKDNVFPLPQKQGTWIRAFYARLSQGLARLRRLQPTLWLDLAELHHDGGSTLFSRSARAWSPTMGFGFDPAGEAPRSLDLADLRDAPYGTEPPVFNRSAAFISRLGETNDAYRVMAGRGIALVLFFAADMLNSPELALATNRFMENSRNVLEPMVAASSFKHHYFYLPLLSSRSIERASGEQLQSWLDGANLYFFENFRDRELVLLSTQDMADIFADMGMSPLDEDETGESVAWEFTVNSSIQD